MYEAFVADAILTLIHAVKMLQEDGESLDDGGSYLDCATDPTQRWQQENKLLEYIKQVRYL